MATALALAAPTGVATAQADTTAARAELQRCIAAAERRDFVTAERIGAEQGRLLTDAIRRRPDDVAMMVTLARVLSQCRIPGAELMQQATFSAEAVELLNRALELEPRHWLARYLLALQHYRAPAFMRRAQLAAEQFDQLLTLQGSRTSPETFARPFEYRGVLWLRAGQPDSARALWQRGLALFPSDTALRNRLQPPSPDTDTNTAVPPEPLARTASPTTVAAVIVRASPLRAPPVLADSRVVQRMDILMAPGATGDLLQAMQLQGGSTLVGDGADLHARGGDPAETPMFLNGARVLGTVRFESLDGALFGAIDPNVVRSARFSPGGFSVRAGDALSGVLEVETDGRPRHAQSRIGLSTVTASATVQQPIGKRLGGWASTRLSHTGPMLWMNGRGAEYPYSPRSADAIANVSFEPEPRTEVRLTALGSTDRVARTVARADVTGPYHATGSSGAAVLRLRRLASGLPLLFHSHLALSGRSSSQALGVLDRRRSDGLATLSSDVEVQVAPAVRVRSGGGASLFTRREAGIVPATTSLAPGAPILMLDDTTASASQLGAWAEAEVERGRLSLVGGLRADRLPLLDRISTDPRLSIAVSVGEARVHASVGTFHQGAWRPLIDVPSPVRLHDVPTVATHYIVGVEGGQALTWRVNGYLKHYGDYERRDGPEILSGTIRGMEMLVRRPALSGRALDGWASYSYTRARARLADARVVPGTFDVSHAAVLLVTWRPLLGTRLGLTSRLATGAPTTDVVGADSMAGGWMPRFARLNGGRLPTYARSDVRLTQLLPLSRGLAVLFVEAINVLDRRNASSYAYDAAWRQRSPVEQFFARRTYVIGLEWTHQ